MKIETCNRKITNKLQLYRKQRLSTRHLYDGTTGIEFQQRASDFQNPTRLNQGNTAGRIRLPLLKP